MAKTKKQNNGVNPETGKISITDAFGANLATLLADKIIGIDKNFDKKSFVKKVEKEVVGRTYTQRVEILADCLRQFFENRNSPKDFFKKTTVKSILFGGTVIVEEPTHTMQEYLSPEFFKYFKIDEFVEASDFYSAEKIGDSEYPTYMIISAIKR